MRAFIPLAPAMLLIAPVWNWNVDALGFPVVSATLLIAPVWNWNRVNVPGVPSPGVLLIAPVWNWNHGPPGRTPWRRCPFNRTSLELKLGSCHQNWQGVRLLIAPVWNWNVWLRDAIRPPRWLLIAPVWNWNERRYWRNTAPCSF